MQYSAEEVADFEAQSGDDAAEPDRAEDIRPIFHKKGKGKGARTTAKAATPWVDVSSTTNEVGPGSQLFP